MQMQPREEKIPVFARIQRRIKKLWVDMTFEVEFSNMGVFTFSAFVIAVRQDSQGTLPIAKVDNQFKIAEYGHSIGRSIWFG